MTNRRPSLHNRMPPGPVAHLLGYLLIPAIAITVAFLLPIVQRLFGIG